jgi:hypothetical protein
MRGNKFKIVVVCLSIILVVIILGVIFTLNKSSPKSNGETDEELTNNLVTETSSDDYTEAEVMKLYHGEDVYTVIKRTANNQISSTNYYINLNDSYYGDSNYNYTADVYNFIDVESINVGTANMESESVEVEEESAVELYGEPFEETEGEAVEEAVEETVEELAIEEEESFDDAESPVDGSMDEEDNTEDVDFAFIDGKAISEDLVYELDKNSAIKFIQSLLNNNFVLDTQISTSTYNEYYLENSLDDEYYRIILLNNQDLMIISEIDSLDINIDSILQKNN